MREVRAAVRLTVEGLAVERGDRLVLHEVGFALERGQLMLVTGPNGSGKSTLLRVLCGLLPARAGRIRLEGGDDEEGDIAAHCHYLGHANALKPALNVRENLSFWRQFHGEQAMTVEAALEAVGLAPLAELPLAYLSTGQRRRVAIARLLVNNRRIWLLDEPTAGLDERSRNLFADLIRSHLEGGMILAATHEPLGITAAAELRLDHSTGTVQ